MDDPDNGGGPANARPTDPANSVAVAVRGDGPDGAGQSRVVASGRGALAQQILEIAWANGVKVRADADLAELLGSVDVDSDIPLEALAAVAEILSYVYRLNGARAAPPPA